MVSDKVVKYIESKLSVGLPEEQIKATLKKAGISDSSITAALKKLKKKAEPSTKKTFHIKSPIQKEKSEQFEPKKMEEPKTGSLTKTLLLKEYIESGIARKVNKEKLKELVIKSGWKKEQVEKVFDEIENKKEKKTEVDIEKKIQLQKSEKEIKSNPNTLDIR